jgi:hypothetical protein
MMEQNFWSNFFLPMLVLAPAVWVSKKTLRAYFLANALNIVGCWIGRQFFAYESNPYRAVYVAVTLPILICAVKLAWEHGARFWTMTISFLLSVVLFILCIKSVKITADNTIVLVEALSLAFVGTAMCFVAPFHKQRRISCALAITWVVLAIYDFGFVLNSKSELLDSLIPVWIIMACSLWVVIFKPYELKENHAASPTIFPSH